MKTEYRKAKHTELSSSSTFTAAIDATITGFNDNPEWHLNAIEFHHKDKDEAERRRDLVFAYLDGLK